MKDYFRILELPENADLDEIKAAYRKLAKSYHPDLNDAPDAAKRFIMINEAYEFLSDDTRRAYYRARRSSRVSEAEKERREAYYRDWIRRQQEVSRQRAQEYARSNYKDFVNSPFYRTAMVMNKVYNYVFLGLGFVMIFTSVLLYLRDGERMIKEGQPIAMVLLPGFIGVMFTYGVWYFLFKHKY